jgi:probable F420-dependent oxidoreductase
VKFSLHIPVGDVTSGQFQSPAAIYEMVSALEAAGVDACWVSDHPAPDADWLHGASTGHDTLDPFAALAFVAARSTTLLLHANVVVLPYRNPFITAKAAATLQVVSGGRFILGVGVGYQEAEFAALGVDFHHRGRLTDEALDTLRATWMGGPVDITSSTFVAAGVEPRPVPDPPPPVWVGGASDKALERAAAWDGWSPFFASVSSSNKAFAVRDVSHLRAHIERLTEMRAAARRYGQFDVCLSARVRPSPEGEYAETLIAEIAELEACGVTWMFVDPLHPSRSAWLEAVDRFGEEVIGPVRAGDRQ